ncbi:DEKNAAC103461 [Brettanomyces naardenensis]|uniref:DEKNAAC103461 n=1 Tax=Brettanomyces naardenensis TaxID=13370 RepID=A0A448YNN3_BRENA|nr:DEKNAAC103461 [Brettanomyces naardenensis]
MDTSNDGKIALAALLAGGAALSIAYICLAVFRNAKKQMVTSNSRTRMTRPNGQLPSYGPQRANDIELGLPAYTEAVNPSQDAGYYLPDGTFVSSERAQQIKTATSTRPDDEHEQPSSPPPPPDDSIGEPPAYTELPTRPASIHQRSD